MKTLTLAGSILVLSVAVAPRTAEARFGKASVQPPPPAPTAQPAPAESCTTAAPPAVHAAQPLPPPPPPVAEVHVAPAPPPPPPAYVEPVRPPPPVYVEPVHRAEPVYAPPPPVYVEPVYAPPPPAYTPPAQVRVRTYHRTQPVYSAPPVVEGEGRVETRGTGRFELIASGQVVGFGGGANLHLLAEGEGAGFMGNVGGFALEADDGTAGYDQIGLLDGQIVFPLLKGEQGRLRLGAGVTVADAPDIMMVGPTVSVSTTVKLIGPFVGDASIALTPWPYTDVDIKAGLGLELGPFELTGGYRITWLDDQGRVDGVAHGDLMSGPYVGLGLVF